MAARGDEAHPQAPPPETEAGSVGVRTIWEARSVGAGVGVPVAGALGGGGVGL